MTVAANSTYKINGVLVKEKIIPDNMKWTVDKNAKQAGCKVGDLYKQAMKIPKVNFVTIHNTEDLSNVQDDAERYTLATYNQAMGTTRVHFYIDDQSVWQNLRAGTGMCNNDPVGSAEIAWHSGDGLGSGSGNMTSLALEIIMNETPANDIVAKDNGARIAAWLLWKHKLPIDRLVTHTYWVNQKAGNTFTDIDKQCTNLVYGKKWCPAYIFGSANSNVAYSNWKDFKILVKGYLDNLNNKNPNTILDASKDGKLYRVQVGAFSSNTNASNYLKTLKAKGINGFIVTDGNLKRIQVGAYSVKANAENYLKELKTKGISGFVVEVDKKIANLKPVDEIALEVINGLWGSGAVRKKRLTDAGYDYAKVQAAVNKLLK